MCPTHTSVNGAIPYIPAPLFHPPAPTPLVSRSLLSRPAPPSHTARKGHSACIRAVLSSEKAQGYQRRLQDMQCVLGLSALHWAVARGHEASVQVLLEFDAYPALKSWWVE